jgi:hypothetical protein
VDDETYSNNAIDSDIIGDVYNSMAMKCLMKNDDNDFNEQQVEISEIIIYLNFNLI